jgi:hypothetical protein
MNRHAIIALAIVIITMTAIALVMRFAVGRNQLIVAPAPVTSSEPQYDEELDPASIENIKGIYEGLIQQMDSYRSYKLDLRNISAVTIDGQKIYVGQLYNVFSNGSIESHPTPVFIAKGILYYPWGYGGNPYPYKETGWITRYKDLEINYYHPVERYSTNIDREELEIYKVQTGIKSISMILDKEGDIQHLEIKLNDQTQKFDVPFIRVKPLTLVTKPEYKDSPDYLTYHEQWRKLPGDAAGIVIETLDTGYTIRYPRMLNGMKVILLRDGNHSYTFNTEDSPNQPSVASFYCIDRADQEIGPQVGEPDPISPESRSKLVDWGKTKEYHADTFSFTGPGYHCQLRVSEAFRLDMFAISF